ncbi:uncharacterized protein LOC135155207 [Lytechinus pictus]|uniref:uncharacterized protein LOC135155207 n=1 Tax=Lytechinus pictus TaxID=7653 RepID=UPI0030B9E1F9
MAGEPNVLTCTALQARPPAILNWIVPDDLISNQQDQTDVVKGNSYTSRKVVTITPSASDQGKHISCFASHQTLQSDRQCIVYLNVHVIPSSTTIFQYENDKDHQTSSTVIYVQEGSTALITCQSIGSRPAVEVSWTIDDLGIPPGNKSLSKTQNPVDGSLFDTKTSPDEIVMTFPAELKEGIKITVTCKAANGYPAPRIYWYIGSRNMTGHSSLDISENDAGRYDAEKTGGFWVSINNGEYLPVIGEDITLVCTFTLQTRNRVVIWQKDGESLATCDCQENRSCRFTVLDQWKFSLVADYSSANLTIKQLVGDDGGHYRCSVRPTAFPHNTVSRSMHVTPLLPASPSVIIVTDRSSRLCFEYTTRTVMAREPNVLTCTASQARPPAILKWIVPDDLISNQQDQTDVVKGNSYTSRKVVTITPSASDQGKNISCFASHQTLQSDRQCIVFLNVHVLPSSTTIFQSGNGKDYQTSSTVIHVQEGSSASISCQSIGSRPAVQMTWRIDDPDIPPGSISLSKTQNPEDDSLFDTVSTYKLHLYRKYQGLILWCFVYLGEDFVEQQFVTISTYAPPDEVVTTFPAELKEGIQATVICKAANGYPAPRIYWYIGSRNMTGHSSLNIFIVKMMQVDAMLKAL